MALRAHFDAATGLPGPRPIVSFRFFIYTDAPQPFVGLSHDILVHALVNEASVPIGPAYLPGAHRFDRAGGATGPQVTPVLPIDFATLRWIEDQRAGRGGVTFYFDWSALGHEEGSAEMRNEPVTLAIGGAPFPVTLHQDAWLQTLHDVRYRDVAVIEIPLLEDPQQVLARSHEHLETARERLYRSDDRGVLVACGEALDVLAYWRRVKLSKEYGYEHLIEDLVGPIFDSSRKAERLGKVLSGVRQMCLSGKHDDAALEGRPIPVDHQDALLAFLMTGAAISYLEHLPLEAAAASAASRSRRRRTRRPSLEAGRPAETDRRQADGGDRRPLPAPEDRAAPLPAPAAEAAAPEAGTPDGKPASRPRRRRRRSSAQPGEGSSQAAAAS